MHVRRLLLVLATLCAAALVLGLGNAVVQGPTVTLIVRATDTSGGTLHYQWRSTDGQITNVDAPTTSWTLPNGPGIHFAYVLVSNGLGGYTERRILVNTDTIGTPPQSPPAQRYLAPAARAQVGDYYRSFIAIGTAPSGNRLYAPNAHVFLTDHTTGLRYPPTGAVSTDLKGQFIIPGVAPSNNDSLTCSVDGTVSDCTQSGEMETTAITDYFLNREATPPPSAFEGSLTLLDDTPCGTVNEFFNVHVTGTATLMNSSGTILAGPAPVNESGDYFLPNVTGANSVLLRCENAPTITVAATSTSLGQSIVNARPPEIRNIVATLNGKQLQPPVAIFLAPPVGLPTDVAPRADVYLAEKGVDSRIGACQYYKAIGAVRGCDASGNLINPISYTDWQKAVKIGKFAIGGVPTYQASYINKVDLNLSRVHQSISYASNNTAAVVCNHLGAKNFLNATQTDIDTSVNNAVAGKNLVACVAMDNIVSAGVNNNQPFVRFLIFGPSGQLLPSVNLDGRREKFVPGTCVVCHGGDHYAGKYPEDGSGFANVGGHFLPYDAGNFEFGSATGLTECDQEDQIYHLNQNVLQVAPTVAEQELIAGWYSTTGSVRCPSSVSHVLNEDYVPASWATLDQTSITFYQGVIARSCRTCHVAMIEPLNFDHYSNLNGNPRLPNGILELPVTVCGQPPQTSIRHDTMPNSVVTFNRFWDSYENTIGIPDQGTMFINFLNDTGNNVCNPPPK